MWLFSLLHTVVVLIIVYMYVWQLNSKFLRISVILVILQTCAHYSGYIDLKQACMLPFVASQLIIINFDSCCLFYMLRYMHGNASGTNLMHVSVYVYGILTYTVINYSLASERVRIPLIDSYSK